MQGHELLARIDNPEQLAEQIPARTRPSGSPFRLIGPHGHRALPHPSSVTNHSPNIATFFSCDEPPISVGNPPVLQVFHSVAPIRTRPQTRSPIKFSNKFGKTTIGAPNPNSHPIFSKNTTVIRRVNNYPAQ